MLGEGMGDISVLTGLQAVIVTGNTTYCTLCVYLCHLYMHEVYMHVFTLYNNIPNGEIFFFKLATIYVNACFSHTGDMDYLCIQYVDDACVMHVHRSYNKCDKVLF